MFEKTISSTCIWYFSSPLALIWANQHHCGHHLRTVLWFHILRAGISVSRELQEGELWGHLTLLILLVIYACSWASLFSIYVLS